MSAVAFWGFTNFLAPSFFDFRQVDSISTFSGGRAYQDVKYQVNLGPRLPGSQAHQHTVDYIVEVLSRSGWQTEIQNTRLMDQQITNVIGKWGSGGRWIILAAHYDSRFFADQDPVFENRTKPVPGANDGASGVAVLLEMARVWQTYSNRGGPAFPVPQLWLVFFDAEDNGNIAGWDWVLGSRAFVSELTDKPDAVVIVDMIGDKELTIYKEKNSDPVLVEEIWSTAEEIGYGMYFLPTYKYRILDDHVPFIQAGIPAVDLIDFDYEYWHTVADTSDKVSPESLQVIGDVLLAWLMK